MDRFRVFMRVWLLALVVCALPTAFSFARIDVPIARHFWTAGSILSPLSSAFGAVVILSLESAVALALALARLVRGHISRLAGTLAIACIASICTYAINDAVLKPCFGVPVPAAVMMGAVHGFDFLAGPGNYSFPSGHMALAASFSGVFMTLYRATVWPLTLLLVLAGVLLVVGDWHFLSDVFAGTFVGLSAGVLAGEVWALHSEQLP